MRQPPVVPLPDHAQLGAHERDGVLLVGGPVRDRRVFHGCSFANQAATFFAKSRSIRRVAFSLRKRSSSARSFSDRSLREPDRIRLAVLSDWLTEHVDADTQRQLGERSTGIEDEANGLILYSWVKCRRVATRSPR